MFPIIKNYKRRKKRFNEENGKKDTNLSRRNQNINNPPANQQQVKPRHAYKEPNLSI